MTISALPSLRQPESIDPKFYFTSDSFLNKIKHDINLLISNFKSRSTSSSSSSSSSIISLVWFDTIIRLFLDYLKVENDPFEQIAALFSIYTFWSTQSKILDPSLFSISSSQPTQLLPSHSLYQIVTHLIQQNAFLIQPIQTALVYPHLPTNSFKLESSLNSILSSNHLNKSTSSLHSKSSFSEQIISTQDEINRWIQSNWNLNRFTSNQISISIQKIQIDSRSF
ncbi:hypothetical protein DFH28DRAFT_421034 [Melampsora americana]|nr:hypothetical protein DFH28DRAFT_421034 [Melampsora americana]